MAALLCGQTSTGHSADKNLIYKQVAADATVVFSDKQAPESTLITPNPINVVASPPPAPKRAKANAKQVDTTKNTVVSRSDVLPTENSRGDVPPKVRKQPVKRTPTAARVGDIKRIDIIAPSQQQILFEHEPVFKLHFYTSPSRKLAEGQQARVHLNSAIVEHTKTNQASLAMPERGNHQIQIDIIDSNGKIVAQSATVDITVSQQIIPLATQ